MTFSRLLILGALVSGGALASTAAVAQPAAAPVAGAQAPAKAPGKRAAKAPASPAAATLAVPAKYPFGLAEARIRGVQNQVEIVSGNDRRPATRDDVVLPGQRIETGNAATVEVSFADGTRVQVAENSQLSIYGAAAPLAAGKKPKPFKPGSNTLSKGEIFVMVPAVAPPPAPAVAPAGKKAVKVKKAVAPKLPATALVVTPVGRIRVLQGAKARITVNQVGITFVAVYEGTSELQGGKGKPLVLSAGTGSKVQDNKTPPGAAAPLPAPPVIGGVPKLVLSTGAAVEVPGTYAAASGVPAPAQWHVQVAADDQFEKVLRESRVPGTDNRLLATPLPPGDYVARVSAVNGDGAEGSMSAPVRVRVAKVTLWPGSEGKRAAVQVEGTGVSCALDGGSLAPMTTPLPLRPAQEHTLRCAAGQPGAPAAAGDVAEFKISAAQSGPLIAKIEPGDATFTETEGQRRVRLILSDAAGNPLSGAKVSVEGAGGARPDAVAEVANSGTYETVVHWPKGATGQSLNYSINGAESYAATLPDAQPQEPEKPKEPVKPASKRFAFEMSLMPLVHVDIPRGVVAVGGGVEFGGRIRLPYGGLAFHLRPQYEYYAPNPGLSHVIAVGLPITYRIRKDVDADVVPYIGVMPQVVSDYSALARDGIAIEQGVWSTQFALGGLVGVELRLRRGAIFVEGGYRYVFNKPDNQDFASLSGVFANLGYRLNF